MKYAGYAAVSYTHLDVYKRQGISFIRVRTSVRVAFGMVITSMPVSYTHLDVYKRQYFTNKALLTFPAGALLCLRIRSANLL